MKIIQGEEWNSIVAQIKPGDDSETPFLVATAAILNKVMPLAL